MSGNDVHGKLAAADLPPAGALIAGEWRAGSEPLVVTDPEDGQLVATAALCSPQDVDEAVQEAVRALAKPWPLHARVEALRAAGAAVADDVERLTRVIAAEGVKTVAQARAEVGRCAETLRVAADSADVLTGQTLPLDASPRGEGRFGWFTREPLGVVAGISSFNDPLNLVAHKYAPALLAGNSIVLKPSEQTPFSALHLARILLDCGVPAGRLSVVCGGVDVGGALVSHELVDAVSFTGGVKAAEAITRTAGVKKMQMELGGNNATIVCADADLALAADKIVEGAFGVAGQNCLSVQRVYAEQPVFDELLSRVAAGAQALVVGSKQDPSTDVGPLVNQTAAQRLEKLVGETVDAGARLVTGGTRNGTFYSPTVLTDVPSDSPAATQELFGPVVMIEAVPDVAEAIRWANDCPFALQAGVFTASLETATQASQAMRVGAVLVNDTSDFRLDAMPFGGFKQSGIGREGPRAAMLALTEPKCVLIPLPSA